MHTLIVSRANATSCTYLRDLIVAKNRRTISSVSAWGIGRWMLVYASAIESKCSSEQVKKFAKKDI